MISLSDAISYPWTVVIELGNADIAGVAVFGTGRTKNVACTAVSISQRSTERNVVRW